MSRFFATGDTTSESEYTESDYDSDKDTKTVKKTTVNRLIQSSDSDDDVRREIKSNKDKRFDELEATCNTIKTSLKNNEWATVSENYDNLQKQFLKAAAVIKTAGVPPFFFKTLLDIDTKATALGDNKEALAKLSPANQKAVNPLKLKVRKILTLYAKQVETYKKNPIVSEPEEESESEEEEVVVVKKAAPAKKATTTKPAAAAAAAKKPSSFNAFSFGESEDEDESEGSEEEVPVKKAAPTSKFSALDSEDESDYSDDYVANTNYDDSDDDGDWARADETASEDDDDDVENINLDSGKITRDFWVKKVTKDDKKPVVKKEKTARKQRQSKKADESEEEETPKSKAAAAKNSEEVTPQALNKRLREIIASRGKRSTDNNAVIEELRFLETKTDDPATILKIQTLITLTQFDLTVQRSSYMNLTSWRACIDGLEAILKTLEQNPSVRLAEDEAFDDSHIYEGVGDDDIAMSDFVDDAEKDAWLARRNRLREEVDARRAAIEKIRAEENSVDTASGNVTYIEGNLYAFVFKVSTEFYKALQQVDNLSAEYVSRLREQPRLISLFKKARAYYQSINKHRLEVRILHLWIEYEYYFYQPKFDVMGKNAEDVPASIVDELADVILKSDDPRARTRALLFQTYFWAIHNRYDAARERYLASHIQDTINDHDIDTRILFNRTMAQIGLAAFRQGEYRAAVSALSELFSNSARSRELIAQGVTLSKIDPREEENAEARRRMYPYHMHINFDLLEAVHLISCAIVEIPIIVESGWHQPRRIVSRQFRKYYHSFVSSLSSHVYLHAESARDAIMIASRALEEGDWIKCYTSLESLKFWSYVPQADVVKKQLEVRIKREALRTYLLSSGSNYLSITMEILVSMFDLPESDVIRITSKMMHSDLISGTWDVSDSNKKIMTIQSAPQNHLQKTCFMWIDKVQQLSERVERLYDQRSFHGSSSNAGKSSYSGNSNADDSGSASADKQQNTRWANTRDSAGSNANKKGRAGGKGKSN